jgi:hypothetical protein
MKLEERSEPWEGACGVYHPILAESVVKFQAETMMETMPAAGPVKTQIIGKETPEKKAAAMRVEQDMNYQITDVMTEYRPEHERMLWGLGLSGNAFKKVYYDPGYGRQVSLFIPPEDVIVPYGATHIETAERVTHVMRKTENEVKRLQSSGFYRDIELGEKAGDVLIITGPNMSGKSTYIRQTALLVIMAQAGSFIPAKDAKLGLVDRIFTRVGASDELVRGQSTFMVEMVETANILNNATPRSLLILDEIGRGTSTYDGLAIARAVAEYIHNYPRLGAKTLFATHYHELVELASFLPRVKNYRIAVKDEGDQIIFLRKIVPGGADKSYGIHVAQLAGLPRAGRRLYGKGRRNE